MEPMELMLLENPKRRKRRRNPEPVFVASPILLAVAGYLAWCGFRYSQTKVWSFTPWKGTAISRVIRANPLRQNYSAFDRAVENMMRPAESVDLSSTDKWKAPRAKPEDEERVSFIMP